MKLIDLIRVRIDGSIKISGFPRYHNNNEFIELNCSQIVAENILQRKLLNAEVDYMEARSDNNKSFIKVHLKGIDETLTNLIGD